MLKKINLWIMGKKNIKRNYTELEYVNIKTEEYFIIDVRTRKEFLEYHLNKSVNIPLSQLKDKIEKVQPNKETKILLYCQTGARSKKAVKILENLGYHKLYNLKGGIENI